MNDMNRILFVTLAAITVALPAMAKPSVQSDSGYFTRPYVGADYQYTHVSNARANGLSANDLLETDLHGGNAHVGLRFHKHMGVELGYQATEAGKKDNVLGSGQSTTLQHQGVTLDFMGYYPIANRLELIGALGISEMYTEAKVDGISAVETWNTKARYGAGAQYWFTDSLNARTMIRYEGVDFDGNNAHNAVQATAGLNFQF